MVILVAAGGLASLTLSSIFQDALTAPSDDASTRVDGRIISLQFASDGSTSWVVSGRWKLDIDYDINGIVPESLKNFSVSLTMISGDGSETKKYVLSDFNTTDISYDKKNHTSTFIGVLNLLTPDSKPHVVNGSFTLFERKIIVITMDPTVTRDYYGDNPIYGIDTQ
jgi:hypothetical protein